MYIGAIPTPAATESRQEFTATANQTVFNTLGGTVGFCDCFLNGVKMANSDFSFDGADVTLTTGAAAGDVLAVVMRQADNALVALPITDSAGNNVLSESAGEITIGSNVNIGTSSFGFLQLNLASQTNFAGANALTILDLGQGTGDTTNITKPSSTSYRIGIKGIYLITFHATFVISGEERYLQSLIQIVNPGTTVSTAFTHIKQADNTTTYATAASAYTGYFSGATDGTSDVQFSCVGGSQGDANITTSTYASIVLIRRTA